jgi:hypothetical protein
MVAFSKEISLAGAWPLGPVGRPANDRRAQSRVIVAFHAARLTALFEWRSASGRREPMDNKVEIIIRAEGGHSCFGK